LSSKNRIVVIGGGFAGARVAQEVAKHRNLANVTLIDRKAHFEVTYATLRAMVEPYTIGRLFAKRYIDFIRGDFIQNTVVDIKTNEVVLENGGTVPYDYAVIATGSYYRTLPILKSATPITLEDRERQFEDELTKISEAQSILVIGGGTVGVELAGEIADKFPAKNIRLVHGTERLVDMLKPRASRIAEKELRKLGVEIIFNEILEPADTDKKSFISKATGNSYTADVVYVCIGISIDTTFMKSHYASSLTERGAIRVDQYLRVKGTDNLFAIGDCSDFPEGKLGYLADKQGAFTAKNVIRLLRAREPSNVNLKRYKPHSMLSLVTIGRKAGVTELPIGVFENRLLMSFKQKELFITRALKHLGTVPDEIK
jgi:NADH dehydrogenase FAD-containing subunit